MTNEIEDPTNIKPIKFKDLLTSRMIILAVVLSFVFGSAGGAFGAFYLINHPTAAQGIFPNTAMSSSGSIITVNEDSAIIDVVKKTSKAVVSIVISKDINKTSAYGNGSSYFDPFNFFGGKSYTQQRASSPAPNVQEVGAGSGFFVSADGLILTNKHVVSDGQASYTAVTSDGKKYDAKVVAQDPVNDLAIVKIDVQNAPFLSLANSQNLQIGQRVIAIGNSLGQYQNTVTTGIISGIGRSITAGDETSTENLSGVIQTDAAINPGNSGGPLLNIAGQVIGINTAIDQEGQLVSFAIPSNEVSKDLQSFQLKGAITKPMLGVRYVTINSTLAKDENLPKDFGALLVKGQNSDESAVLSGSPADKAGLMENDIILEVNGQKVTEKNPLPSILKSFGVGDKITLKIYHKGSEKNISLTLAETK